MKSKRLTRSVHLLLLLLTVFLFLGDTVKAQLTPVKGAGPEKQSPNQFYLNNDSAFRAGTPNSGRLWGYVFADYFYKDHSDSLNRGGNNQYTNVKQGTNEFQFRRIYLGYDYNISRTFSAEFLLAAEDDFTTGDLLQNNKFTPYIKYANLRWKNFLFKGNDFLFGLQGTPAFPYMTENIFTYSRPIERTITDIRRTPSFDFGFGLQGRFNSPDSNVVFGYNFLFANGTSAKPENLTIQDYKWFYGDAFIGFFNHRLIFDIYADYQRQNWTTGTHGHSYRQMLKGAVAYVGKSFTIGAEGYVNDLVQAEAATNAADKDTLDGRATGLSLYAHYNLIGTKLRIFGRYDFYNPNILYQNTIFDKYATLYTVSKSYEPNNKERFFTFGFDYSPTNNIHIMPNVWWNQYQGQQAGLTGKAAQDYDLVYRLTFYFTFGRLFVNPKYSYYPYIH
jgi:hypothetical protein